MTNGREMTPQPGFSTPPQIPNITTSKRPLITTIVFAATTPENMPFAYHASTLTNSNLMISPAFVETNYEILESLLRERRRQTHNEDLQTELKYFTKDYDEKRDGTKARAPQRSYYNPPAKVPWNPQTTRKSCGVRRCTKRGRKQ
ncbi:hypothetical protein Tco_1548804 [Tanacetum coccineum]